MRTELTPDTLPEFQEKFGRLHDALILHVHYMPYNQYEIEQLRIIIGVPTYSEPLVDNDNWVNLSLEFEEPSKLVIKRAEKSTFSVIFRANFGFYENEIYVDFHQGELTDLKDLDPSTATGPELAVIAKRCYWSIAPTRFNFAGA